MAQPCFSRHWRGQIYKTRGEKAVSGLKGRKLKFVNMQKGRAVGCNSVVQFW